MGGIIATIIGGAGHFISGGTLGVFGSIATGVLDYFNRKKEVAKEIVAINAQKELAIAQANGQALIETLKIQQAAVSASYEHDTKTLNIGKDIVAFFNTDKDSRSNMGYLLFLMAFGLDFLRGSLRPIMCYLLFGTAAGITVYAIRKCGINQAVLHECARYGLYTCMDAAGMVIGWYFGDRQQAKIKRVN